MSATIQSLVIPVSDLDAAKGVYTALLGAPHTDQAYYVGYNVNGFEVALTPGDVSGDRWPTRTSTISTGPVRPCSRLARRSAAPRAKSHPRRGCACSPTPTATPSAGAAGSRRVAGPRPGRRGPGLRIPGCPLRIEAGRPPCEGRCSAVRRGRLGRRTARRGPGPPSAPVRPARGSVVRRWCCARRGGAG
jgi:hypothetical protein